MFTVNTCLTLQCLSTKQIHTSQLESKVLKQILKIVFSVYTCKDILYITLPGCIHCLWVSKTHILLTTTSTAVFLVEGILIKSHGYLEFT